MSQFRVRWSRYKPYRFTGTPVACNLCGGEDHYVVSHYDRWFNRMTNVSCRSCGLVFLNPMPDDREVDEYYRRHFWRRSQGDFLPTPKRLRRDRRDGEGRVRTFMPMLEPGMRLLDIGSGSGEFLAAAKRAGFEVEGIEPSEDYAAYSARQHDIVVHTAPLAAIDFGERKFDMVTSNHAFEHMRDPLDSFRRCHALLKPGGLLYISVPDLSEKGAWPLRNFHFGHLHGFSHETLVMMAAKAGFAQINTERRDTNMLFRRLDAPRADWMMYPQHGRAMEAMFRQNTIWHYLTRPSSYSRISRRIRNWLSDFLSGRAFKSKSRGA